MSSFCRVCGSHNAMYHRSKHQMLCDPCASETPDKVDFITFIVNYWGNDASVSDHVQRCVYADYLAGCNTLEKYIERTKPEEV